MSSAVKVSVVIPVYNAEDYLHKCFETLINQTLKEIEIICVDDGSTDNSLEIMHEYAKKDSRIHVLTQQNQYAGAARNAGMRIATGEYIHFLDSDDYLALNAYEVLYRKAKQYNADMVKARACSIDAATGAPVTSTRYKLLSFPDSAFKTAFNFYEHPTWFSKIDVVPWNGIYKLDFIKEHAIEFNRLRCVNDRSFYKNIILHAKRIILTKDVIAYHRINLQTSLVGQRAKNFECHFESYRIIEKLSLQLPEKLRAIYMEAEMLDVLSWFKSFRNGVLGENITNQVIDFLKDTDASYIIPNCKYMSWLNAWVELTEKIINSTESAMEPSKKAALQELLTIAKRKLKLQNSKPMRALRKFKNIKARILYKLRG